MIYSLVYYKVATTKHRVNIDTKSTYVKAIMYLRNVHIIKYVFNLYVESSCC